MTRILLESKNDGLLIQYGKQGNIEGYTKDYINLGYNARVTVSNKELSWQHKQLQKINKSILKSIK